MPKQSITIRLDSEIAKTLRMQSIKKYGNSRSMSRFIEDLATGAAEVEQSDACSILGHRSEYSFQREAEFTKAVDEITAQLTKIPLHDAIRLLNRADRYFALKDACELQINDMAKDINKCYECNGLSSPVPKYESAGKNFAIYATMNINLR